MENSRLKFETTEEGRLICPVCNTTTIHKDRNDTARNISCFFSWWFKCNCGCSFQVIMRETDSTIKIELGAVEVTKVIQR